MIYDENEFGLQTDNRNLATEVTEATEANVLCSSILIGLEYI